MRSILFTFVAMILVSCAGCPTRPLPPIIDAGLDAGSITDAPTDTTVDIFETACSNMEQIGCAEGEAFNCSAVLEHVVKERITIINVQCMISAKSKAEIRKCGSIKCL